jgi:hypothetical protein
MGSIERYIAGERNFACGLAQCVPLAEIEDQPLQGKAGNSTMQAAVVRQSRKSPGLRRSGVALAAADCDCAERRKIERFDDPDCEGGLARALPGDTRVRI